MSHYDPYSHQAPFVPEKHPVWKDRCGNCGTEGSGLYIFVCPNCEDEGCPECFLAGRGCLCPKCEEPGREEE